MLEKWLANNPDDAEAWSVLGGAHYELEDWQESVRAARRATKLRPDKARYWCNLGTVLRKLGYLSSAADAQRRALSLDDGYQRAEKELARVRAAEASEDGDTAASGEPPSQSENGASPLRGGNGADDVNWRSVVVTVAGVFLALVVAAGVVNAVRGWAGTVTIGPNGLPRISGETPEQQRSREVAAARLRQYRIDQQMRRNTIQYVDRRLSCGDGGVELTEAQLQARWENEFKGHWVRWEGEVVEVTSERGCCTVHMCCRPGADEPDARFDLNRAAALELSRGQRIRIAGRLDDREDGCYELRDARVVAKW